MSGSANTEVFHAVIRAMDEATAPLRKIQAEIQRVGAAAVAAGRQTEHVHHPHMWAELRENISLTREHFGELHAGIRETAGSLAEFAPALAALGAGASLVGLFELTEHVSEATAASIALASKIGITGQQLGALSLAAKLTDVPVESMTGGLGKLQLAMEKASQGKNALASAMFARMGIALKDAQGHMRSVADVLPEIANAMQHTTDAAMKTYVATTLLGRGGRDLLPLLNKGAEGIEEAAVIAKKVNFAPTSEQKEGLEEYHKSWIELQAAANGFTKDLGAQLAPVLNPVIIMMRDWVVENRHWIATEIAKRVRQLSVWIKGMIPEIKANLIGMRDWIKAHEDTGKSLGALKTAIGAVVLVIGAPFIAPLIAITKEMKALSVVIFGPVLGALRVFITTMYAGEGAMTAFSASFAANPFGVILLAVAALGYAAYELYEHWDWVKVQFTALWQWFASTRFGQFLIAQAHEIAQLPAMVIMPAWDWLKAQFTALGQWFESSQLKQFLIVQAHEIAELPATVIMPAWAALKDFFAELGKEILVAFAPIEQGFKTIWDGVARVFTAAWDGIKGIVDKVTDAAQAIASLLPASAPALPAGLPKLIVSQAAGIVRYTGADPDRLPLGPRFGIPENLRYGVNNRVNLQAPPDLLRFGIPRDALDAPRATEGLYPPPAPAAPPGQVEIHVKVDAPPGATVDAQSRGAGVAPPQVDLGRAFQLQF